MDYAAQKKSALSLWHIVIGVLFWVAETASYAVPNDIDLSVWVNEAIVSTYTFNADNFLERQKAIAKYFTPEGWINYAKALQAAQLRDSVAKYHYKVSAVALLPPSIKFLAPSNEWQATMPLLVLYQGQEYQQKQTLEVVISFVAAKANQGVRGLALTSFTSTVTTQPCRCEHGLKTKIVV